MSYRLVLVEWFDSIGVGHHWEAIDNPIAEPHVCRSVGWLVAEGDHAIVVIPHMHDADDRRNVPEGGMGDMTIPRCSIKRMVTLVEKQDARAKKPGKSPPGTL